MNISHAALPPIQPHISKRDREHLLFPLYQQYRASMSALLVQSDGFRDWLAQYERQKLDENFVRHPKYPEFLAWMRAVQAGARKCPAGNFPDNFNYWLVGGRW